MKKIKNEEKPKEEVKVIKFDFPTRNIVALACLAIGAYGMWQGKEGFGWFVFIGFMCMGR